MPLTLQGLRDWVPEIADLAAATNSRAAGHTDAADFYQAVVRASHWQGDAAQEAIASMLLTAAAHAVRAEDLTAAAKSMEHAERDADSLAATVRSILDDAAANPAVQVDQTANSVQVPSNYEYLDDDTKTKVSEKIADLEARIADALAEVHRIDAELAKAMAKSTGLPDPTPSATTLPELLGVPTNGPLRPGEVRNLGPVAGTGNPDAIPGIRAADLGEIITLPNGKQIAIFGDSYGEPHVAGKDNPHYSSVAVPVTFDKNGKPHFGVPLNGTTRRPGYHDEAPGPNPLFPMPHEAMTAGANNTLPAGSITTKDGKTYMMVVGTNTSEGLAPKGGSWLVEVTNDPANGWKPVPGSYQPWQPIENPNAAPGTAHLISDPTKPPTQISGYQGSDGRIYIAADGFDRQQGVTMYSVDPEHIGDRNAWHPWTGNGWGQAGPDSAQHAANISQGDNFGEISLR